LKTTLKATPKRAARDLFGELSAGIAALAEARHGKRTLPKSVVVYKPPKAPVS